MTTVLLRSLVVIDGNELQAIDAGCDLEIQAHPLGARFMVKRGVHEVQIAAHTLELLLGTPAYKRVLWAVLGVEGGE